MDNFDKWVAALESGTYEQTTGRLKYEDSFCCLGVACDLVKGQIGTWELGDFVPNDAEYEDGACDIEMPNFVQNYYGLNPKFKYVGYFEPGKVIVSPAIKKLIEHDNMPSLSDLNDRGATFIEIAQFLRDNKEYFTKPK